MDENVVKGREEIWIERYSKRLKSQNGEHFLNLCKSNNFETQVKSLVN